MQNTTAATASPYSLNNLVCHRHDPLRSMRRDRLTQLVNNEAGERIELLFPSHRNLVHHTRDIDFAGGVFDEARRVRLLQDELAPHSNLVKAGARVVPLGDSPTAVQLLSVDPELLAGWQTTPELAAETLLCVLDPRRLSCKINFSKQLLKMQPDLVVPWVERQLYSALAAELERAALLGSGADGQPCGLLLEPTVETIAAAVAPASIATAEQEIAEAFLDGGLSVLTSPLVRKNFRGTAADKTAWHPQIPQFVSPHLKTAGNTPGEIAIVGNFSDFIVGTWGPVVLQSNPYSRSTEGFIECLAEMWVDVISLRPGAFRIINPAA